MAEIAIRRKRKLFQNSNVFRLDLLTGLFEYALKYFDEYLSIVISPNGPKEYESFEVPPTITEPCDLGKFMIIYAKPEPTKEQKAKGIRRGDLPYLMQSAHFDEDLSANPRANELDFIVYSMINIVEYSNVKVECYNYRRKLKHEIPINLSYDGFMLKFAFYEDKLKKEKEAKSKGKKEQHSSKGASPQAQI